jgi:hypothetical protein
MQPEAKQPKPTQACGEGAPTGVRLLYASEWAQPVLHFRVGVNAWQDQPLQALRSSNGKWQVSGRCALKGAERNQSTRLVWLLALAHFLPLLSSPLWATSLSSSPWRCQQQPTHGPMVSELRSLLS